MATASTTQMNRNDSETGATAAEKLAEAAHAGIDNAAKVGASAEMRLREAQQEAISTASGAKEKAVKTGSSLVEQTEKNIKKSPLVAAGTAFAVGFVVSALLRR